MPAPELDLRVVDPQTRRVAAAGRVGEVWVRSGCVAAGYWNRPEESRAAFENRVMDTGEGPFLATGDLGFVTAGRVYITGRLKDLVIVRGRNIYPQDVEAAVAAEIGFIEPNGCAAFSVEGAGSEPVIGIVAEADRATVRTAKTEPARVEDVAATIRAVVAGEFGVSVGPVVFVRPGTFPRTSSGKVQRRACRDGLLAGTLDVVYESREDGQMSGGRADGLTDGVADPASSPLAGLLHRIFLKAVRSRGLAVDRLAHDESLLSWGVDSVGFAAAVAEVERATGIRLEPAVVYAHPTISHLAGYLRGRLTDDHGGTARHSRNGTPPNPGAGSPGEPRGSPPTDPLGGSLADFSGPTGVRLKDRIAPYTAWRDLRQGAGVWPFHRVARSPAAPSTLLGDEHGGLRPHLNFGSQDYLGLARDPRVLAAAQAAISEYGVHSAGSPALLGTTPVMAELERRLAAALGKEDCMVYPTGWAAGFGVVTGLVCGHDTLVLDALSHRCLMEGAYHVTRHPILFRHNDLDDLRQSLQRARRADKANGLFVVAESLYSMDADSPDLHELTRLVREWEGVLILDVAHDFGAMGTRGLGLLQRLDGTGLSADVVMGSFSKTFAATGGFVAADRGVIEYLRGYTTPYVFSNAISPVQAAAALECCRIAFSDEGDRLRARLEENALALREALHREGFRVGGRPSPIVPVFVGDEGAARLTARQIALNGLLANLVEYPAVPRGGARFRFQVMSTHTPDMAREAAAIFARSHREVVGVTRDARCVQGVTD